MLECGTEKNKNKTKTEKEGKKKERWVEKRPTLQPSANRRCLLP
jgi:hypothetical protein